MLNLDSSHASLVSDPTPDQSQVKTLNSTSNLLYDKNGRELVIGAQAIVEGFEDALGTILDLVDDQYGRYAVIDFSKCSTLSECADVNDLCLDVELV